MEVSHHREEGIGKLGQKHHESPERYVDEIALESLRESFHTCTNKRDFVLAVGDPIHYLGDRKVVYKLWAMELPEAQFLKPIGSKPREVHLRDHEIAEGLILIEEKWDEDTVMLYRFMVYSGFRLVHVVKALSDFDKRNLEIVDNVAVYPMTHFVAGDEKRAF